VAAQDLRVTGLGNRVISAVFPLIFAAMFGAFFWRAATLRDGFIEGLPAGTPRWVQWLILILLAAVAAYVCWGAFRQAEIKVVGDRLRIQGVLARADVPLSDVIEVEWIDRRLGPVATPNARLTLRNPCRLGTDIYFVPRSVAAFNALRDRVALNDRKSDPR